MSNMKSLADCSDWGCDIHGRDAAQRGVTPARVYEGWGAGAGGHVDDSGVSVAECSG